MSDGDNRYDCGERPMNCWEFKKCGREPGGAKAADLGVCPAAVDPSGHGMNAGVAGGRICWAVTGTLCGGQVQGAFAQKELRCLACDFFSKVQAEEGERFVMLRTTQSVADVLRQSEERYRSLFDGVPVGLYRVSAAGIFLDANFALLREIGCADREALRQKRKDDLYVNPVDLERWHAAIARNGHVRGFEVELRRCDGARIWVRENARVVKADDGHALYYEGSIEDITERRRLDEELHAHREHLEELVEARTAELSALNANLGVEIAARRRAQEELEKARDDAESANRTKSAFLASMSHELRTPLNAIIGYGEMLLEDAESAGNATGAEDVKKVIAAGRHLLALINDVLDISKIEAGRVELYLERFSVGDAVNEVVGTVQLLAKKNANTLRLELAPDLGEIRADLVRVRQVLFNLLSNACKFTENGTVTLSGTRETVDGVDWIRFRVEDSGIGITPEQQANIFQPFTQGDSSTTRKYGGTGLGLAISRRLCMMMGGELSLESMVGRGSVFSARIPAEVVVGKERGSLAKRAGGGVEIEGGEREVMNG